EAALRFKAERTANVTVPLLDLRFGTDNMRAERWMGRTAGIVSVTKRFVRSLERLRPARKNSGSGQGRANANRRSALAALALISAFLAPLPRPAREESPSAASEIPAFQFSTRDRVR